MRTGLVATILGAAALAGCNAERYTEKQAVTGIPVPLVFKVDGPVHTVAAQLGSHGEISDAAYMAGVREVSYVGRDSNDAQSCVYRRFNTEWFEEQSRRADHANEQMLYDAVSLARANGAPLKVKVLPQQRTHGGCYILTETPTPLLER